MIGSTAVARDEEREEGFSLIELLMVMVVFSIIAGIILSVTTVMLRQQRRQVAVGDNLGAARKILQRLDAQVRYANAINTPGTAPDGNFYVEWRTGNVGQQQYCTQWRRVTATNQLQFRSWQPPLNGFAAVPVPAWNTLASTIKLTGGTAIFKPGLSGGPNAHQRLIVTFTSTSGSPPVSTDSQIAITALNSPNGAPTGLCNEVARS